MLSLARMIVGRLKTALVNRRYRGVFRRFSHYTMIPPADYVTNLWLARSVAGVAGCIVECGVWRGGMSGGIATVLGPKRHYYLCDSFAGLPDAKEVDGPAAIAWQNDVQSPQYYDNCTAEEREAREAMRLAEATSVSIVKGWFKDTLPDLPLDGRIALLRLDGDWYESTMTCLDCLFDKVAAGGVIIIDDYYTWDGCSRAVHDFLSRRSATERIEKHGRVCFIVKKPTASSPAP